MVHPCSPTHAEQENSDPCPSQDGLVGRLHGSTKPAINLKTAADQRKDACIKVTDMNIEERLEQVATVINQIDDPKVPRNIRRQAKEACENWLLNKGKKLDVRIAMAQSKLEELYEDPNIPPEFGTLILTINTELERILTEVL